MTKKILNRKTKIKENAYLAILIHSENVCWLIFPGLTSACMLINLKNDKKKAMMIWKNVFAKIDNEDMAKNRHISYEKM